MSYSWNQLTVTSEFSDALSFSNAKAAEQTAVVDKLQDLELSELRFHLEESRFSVRLAMEEGKDVAFNLERTGKRIYGIVVLRKNAISVDLLCSISKFLENRTDTQIVIVNGCNPIGDSPEEEVPDFWVCLVEGSHFIYVENAEVTKLFQRERQLKPTNGGASQANG